MSVPNNLPMPRAPIVGREKELAAAQLLLLREDVYLVTLTGPGGIGKTRLALQVAMNLLDNFEDGVFFVSLATITNPDLVLPIIAHTLGLRAAADTDSPVSALESLKSELHTKRLLLVVDSFEQVISAASVLYEVISSAAHLTVLVTSRESLHLQNEHELSLAPLSLPDTRKLPALERLIEYDAVRLFIARSQAVKPDFALTNQNAPAVAEICARLDGLPLAIELAAARTRLLPPQAMLARLESRLRLLTGGSRDLPARQQTLRDTIAWSYDLLNPGEQALFQHLSVFVGGCALEPIEAVRGAGALQIDALDGLDSLVRKSLLRQEEQKDGQPRFLMLQTIREFGLERLAESSEEESVHNSHMEYYCALAEEAEPHLRDSTQATWLDMLEIEHDNLRTALLWSLRTHPRFEASLRMASALERFWQVRGYISEGRDRLAEVLSLPGALGPTAARAKALSAAGRLAFHQYDYRAAALFFEESLAIQRALSDREGVGLALTGLGGVAQRQEEYAAAHSLYAESLAIARDLGDTLEVASSVGNMGLLALQEEDYERANTLLAESLDLFKELGAKDRIALTLDGLAQVASRRGDYERASALFKESLALLLQVGYKWAIANGLIRLARVTVETEPARAARLLGAADSLFDVVRVRLDPAEQEAYDLCLAQARTTMDNPAFEAAWSNGRDMTPDEVVTFALSGNEQQSQRQDSYASPPLAASQRTRATSSARSESAYVEDLTGREDQILRLVAAGKSNPQIANELYLSINTVQAHLRSVFSKLGVASRIEAVRYAFDRNLASG